MRAPTLMVPVLLALSIASAPARAALNVLACEPEWGALATELGGDRVTVYNATTALQDVHHVQARPSLIAAARRADLAVCTGAELEVGWLPVLQSTSGNHRIQSGTPGYFEAAHYVTLLEVPARLDRSQGDVHPAGDPHIQTDPRNVARVAEALANRLAELDPANRATYEARLADFSRRWRAAIERWEATAAPLKGTPVVEHHKAFTYLFRWLGISAVGFLEPKPGVEPTTGHMAELLEGQQRQPATLIIRASYADPRASEWFAQRAGIPVVVLPTSVGGDDAAKDLFSWFDDLIARLLEARR